jgi:hypothetical protein
MPHASDLGIPCRERRLLAPASALFLSVRGRAERLLHAALVIALADPAPCDLRRLPPKGEPGVFNKRLTDLSGTCKAKADKPASASP